MIWGWIEKFGFGSERSYALRFFRTKSDKMKSSFTTPDAQPFVPHDFQERVVFKDGLPKIYVSQDAYRDMRILVGLSPTEVGWIGSVVRVDNNFIIEEVFLIDQQAHGTTTVISEDGLAQWGTEIMKNRRDGMEVANRIRFWGHSHVNMGTGPSSQDDKQMDLFAETCGDFFIRGILNKKGRMEFTLYLYSVGLEIRDVSWELFDSAQDEDRITRWKTEIGEKVRPFVVRISKGKRGGRVTVFSGISDLLNMSGGTDDDSSDESEEGKEEGGGTDNPDITKNHVQG